MSVQWRLRYAGAILTAGNSGGQARSGAWPGCARLDRRECCANATSLAKATVVGRRAAAGLRASARKTRDSSYVNDLFCAALREGDGEKSSFWAVLPMPFDECARFNGGFQALMAGLRPETARFMFGIERGDLPRKKRKMGMDLDEGPRSLHRRRHGLGRCSSCCRAPLRPVPSPSAAARARKVSAWPMPARLRAASAWARWPGTRRRSPCSRAATATGTSPISMPTPTTSRPRRVTRLGDVPIGPREPQSRTEPATSAATAPSSRPPISPGSSPTVLDRLDHRRAFRPALEAREPGPCRAGLWPLGKGRRRSTSRRRSVTRSMTGSRSVRRSRSSISRPT